jgi:RNA polymerase sigma-70 factor, ECF subfamily
METPHSEYNDVISVPGQSEWRDTGDTVVVIAIGRRNQGALAECYRRHGGPLYRLAQRLLGDDRLAEEAVQEVFLQLWQKPEAYDPDRASLRSWLLMRTHGRAVDLLRSESARRTREQRDSAATIEPAYDLEREIWDTEVAERVQRAMVTLPEAERRAISLAYFGGHSYREVADILGRPEGTVKSQIRGGLKRLRSLLLDVAYESGLQDTGTGHSGKDSTGSTSFTSHSYSVTNTLALASPWQATPLKDSP